MKELISIVYKQLQKKKNKKALKSEDLKEVAGSKPEPRFALNYYQGKRIGALVGVFLLLKRSVYLDSKGFDPDFFMYDEEMDWFLNRLRKYNIVYYPDVFIFHFFGKSDVYKKMSLQHRVSQYLFWYKMSVPHFLLFILYNIVEIPSKAIISIVTLNNKHLSEIPYIFKAFPYALFDIPRYSNKYGSRKNMLKLKSLKKAGL
jgi:GT2 family glycosyltransferase